MDDHGDLPLSITRSSAAAVTPGRCPRFPHDLLQPTFISTSSSLMTLEFGYGSGQNNGNVRSQKITRNGLVVGTQNYQYDPLNRLDLADEEGGTAWSKDYTYDRYGNRSLSTWGYTFNANNNRFSNGSFDYDLAGNLEALNGVADLMAYDANNKMTTFTNPGATKSGAYRYDSQGNRVRKIATVASNTVTTTYVYDAFGKLTAEYSSEAQGTTFEQKFRTADHLGSTRLITDANGAAETCRDFFPFGERIDSGTGNRSAACYGGVNGSEAFSHMFTAKERDDESGLDYFLARYYASSLGRFAGPDEPLLDQSTANPQSWNLYGYVRNRPLSSTDPDGRICFLGFGGTCDEENEQELQEAAAKDGRLPSPPPAPTDPRNGVYPSVDAAGVAAARLTAEKGKEGGGIEFASSVHTIGPGDGTAYTFTTPVTQGLTNQVDAFNTTGRPARTTVSLLKPPIPAGTTFVGGAHNHPAGSGFSSGDRARANLFVSTQVQPNYQGSYLGLLDGTVLKYDPNTRETSVLVQGNTR